MNSNFNQQFMILDFALLENRDFLAFVGSSEFATYLVLRRNVWRSATIHYMGLHDFYAHDRKLVCSITREKIAACTGVAPDNISRHLSGLEQKGIIRRIATGRQNIYVLGEWVDVHGDGSYKVEWFYLEGSFGVAKPDPAAAQAAPEPDLTLSVRPELTADERGAAAQTRRAASDNNRYKQHKENTQQQQAVVQKLCDMHIGKQTAERLAARYPAAHIEQKIALLRWRLERAPGGQPISDPAAWLVRAIEDDYQAPVDARLPPAQRRAAVIQTVDEANRVMVIEERPRAGGGA